MRAVARLGHSVLGAADLENFANGQLSVTQSAVSGVARAKISKLKRGQSEFWSLQVPVKDLNLSCFGVYPLTVQAGRRDRRRAGERAHAAAVLAEQVSRLQNAARPEAVHRLLGLAADRQSASGRRALACSTTSSPPASPAADGCTTWSTSAAPMRARQPDVGDRPGPARQRDDDAQPYRVGNSVKCSHNRVHPADKQAGKLAVQPDQRHGRPAGLRHPVRGCGSGRPRSVWQQHRPGQLLSPMAMSWPAGCCIALRRPRRSRPGPSSCPSVVVAGRRARQPRAS